MLPTHATERGLLHRGPADSTTATDGANKGQTLDLCLWLDLCHCRGGGAVGIASVVALHAADDDQRNCLFPTTVLGDGRRARRGLRTIMCRGYYNPCQQPMPAMHASSTCTHLCISLQVWCVGIIASSKLFSRGKWLPVKYVVELLRLGTCFLRL